MYIPFTMPCHRTNFSISVQIAFSNVELFVHNYFHYSCALQHAKIWLIGNYYLAKLECWCNNRAFSKKIKMTIKKILSSAYLGIKTSGLSPFASARSWLSHCVADRCPYGIIVQISHVVLYINNNNTSNLQVLFLDWSLASAIDLANFKVNDRTTLPIITCFINNFRV